MNRDTEGRDWLAERFEGERPRLRAVAYRMLGSTSEAEDAVQEAWMRLDRSDTDAVVNLQGWLTSVVARICLDMLRARRSRREQDLDGWPLELVVSVEPDDDGDPQRQVALADSVGVALLVVLETLSPAERLAFVLHDMFAVPFGEIAGLVDRTPAATRQLVSRARRRVQSAAPSADADLGRQRTVVDAFLAASRAGDFEGLLAVLDPDVAFRLDGGSFFPSRSLVGAETVVNEILLRGTPFAPMARPAVVNGRAGALVRHREHLIAVVAFTVAGGRITGIDLLADPEKLRDLDRPT